MKLVNRAGTISAGDTEQDVSYGIEFNPFMASLLSDKLYTDKPTACWRELYANAHDESDNIKVQLPTHNDPTCVIWDNGPGLDQSELISLFCTYGASNKRGTNSKIGGFGVGSKVLFSYTDTFSATSVKNGVRTEIVCYKDNKSMPTARIVGAKPSDEQSGTRIQWGVTPYDAEAFRSAALEVFTRFKNKPTFLCATTPSWPATIYSLETSKWSVRDKSLCTDLKKTGSGAHMVMGGIAYPVSSRSLNNYSKYEKMCRGDVDIFTPIGSVQLAASREALSYDEATIGYVCRRLEDMSSEASQLIEDQIAGLPTWYEKEVARDKLVRPVPFISNNRGSSSAYPSQLDFYHEVKAWNSRGRSSTARLQLSTDLSFRIIPSRWESARLNMKNDFSDPPERVYGNAGYQCVLRFPTGTTTPSGFTTRAAEFIRQHGLTSLLIIPDKSYEWCLQNQVPVDGIVLWDKAMHEKYRVPADSTYVSYRRKNAAETTLYKVRFCTSPSSLNLNQHGVLKQLREDEPAWFLLANNGSYSSLDNPAVGGREPEIGYLCALGNMGVYLVPKSYSGVLGGNFMNINKNKEKFDQYLKEEMSKCDMLDGYVQSQLRTKFRELSDRQVQNGSALRMGIEKLSEQDTWDVPPWFQRFTRVILGDDYVWNSAQHLDVDKTKAASLTKKEFDITVKRLHKKPLAFFLFQSVLGVRHSARKRLASEVSAYLK